MKSLAAIVLGLTLATSGAALAAPNNSHRSSETQGAVKEALYSVPLATPECPKAVRKALKNQPGVLLTRPSLKTKSVRVKFDSSRTSAKHIAQIIREKTPFVPKLIRVTDAK